MKTRLLAASAAVLSVVLLAMAAPALAGGGASCSSDTLKTVEAGSSCSAGKVMSLGAGNACADKDVVYSKGDKDCPAAGACDKCADGKAAMAAKSKAGHACCAEAKAAGQTCQGCATGMAKMAEKKACPYTTALMDQKGHKVRLADHMNKTLVVEFVNPQCPFIVRHYKAGTSVHLAKKYADKGVQWVSVNSSYTQGVQDNAAFAKKYNVPYPVLDDHAGIVGHGLGAKTTPHVVIFHKGKVVYNGAMDNDPRGKLPADKVVNYVDAALSEVLAGKAVAMAETKPYGCSVKYAPETPSFTLKDQNGKAVSLSDYNGKIVVLEWVNPDCPFVKRHDKAGTMIDLARKYGSQGVVWLAVNTTHYFDQARNKVYAEKLSLPYPVLDDSAGKVGRMFGAKTTPHMFVLNRKHEVVYEGAIDNDPRGKLDADKVVNYVDQALTQTLAGQKVSTPKTRPYGCSVKYAPAKDKGTVTMNR